MEKKSFCHHRITAIYAHHSGNSRRPSLLPSPQRKKISLTRVGKTLQVVKRCWVLTPRGVGHAMNTKVLTPTRVGKTLQAVKRCWMLTPWYSSHAQHLTVLTPAQVFSTQHQHLKVMRP